MQEYRYTLLASLVRFFELFGFRRPVQLGPAPVPAGEYDEAVHEHPDAPSQLTQYFQEPREPQLGGPPKETERGEE